VTNNEEIMRLFDEQQKLIEMLKEVIERQEAEIEKLGKINETYEKLICLYEQRKEIVAKTTLFDVKVKSN
jgi:hypothetical protein